jgi:hypothetical protein
LINMKVGKTTNEARLKYLMKLLEFNWSVLCRKSGKEV